MEVGRGGLISWGWFFALGTGGVVVVVGWDEDLDVGVPAVGRGGGLRRRWAPMGATFT